VKQQEEHPDVPCCLMYILLKDQKSSGKFAEIINKGRFLNRSCC